ncbi:hypothetical protein MKEN_00410800 [Mycena kentingensis (nom. inval.)]|nr:hypothetical protein MKEN_00410800 [Mycena kentingensis (nom. inval.)]
MKISNKASIVVYNQLTVSYTVEPGDPAAFWFQVVVDNGFRQDIEGRKTFSTSGSFTTGPGYTGGHHVEAFRASDVPGRDEPFVKGPVYNVLPQGSTVPNDNDPPPARPPPPTTTTRALPPTTPANRPPPSTSTKTIVQVPPSAPSVQAAAPTGAVLSDDESDHKSPDSVESESNSGHTATDASSPGSALAIAVSTTTERSTETSAVNTGISSNASSGGLNTSALLGGILGAVVALVLVLILLLLLLRNRRRRRQREIAADFDPSLLSAPSNINRVAPFLAFAAAPLPSPVNEKRRGFARLSDSSAASRSSTSTLPSSPSPLRIMTTRLSLDGAPTPITNFEVDSSTVPTPSTSATQMEWVLRPTNDPPPGYSPTSTL